jgi:hypothetical protein
MSIFKNTSNGMCISQGEFGHTLDGRDLMLRKCNQYDDILTLSSTLQGEPGTEYMIKKGNNCIKPGEKDKNGDYKLIAGECDDTSNYKLYEDSRNINDQYVDQLTVYFIFSNNHTAYLNGTSRLWGTLLTYNNHKYGSGSSIKNAVHYFVIYDFDNKMKISEIMEDNKIINCKIKYIIEEYDENNNPINLSTTYYLVVDDKDTMLYFTSDQSLNKKKLLVHTYAKNKYNIDELGREDNNVRNFNLCRIGTIVGGKIKYAKVDTRRNIAGMTLENNGTRFRMLTKNNLDEFKLLFHYPYNKKNLVNISSYINPVKKVIAYNKNNIKTRNMKDGTRHNKAIFKIIPKENNTNMENMENMENTNIEGYTNLIEGMKPRCEITINGTCSDNSKNIPLNTSFIDSDYGGPIPYSDYDCKVRAHEWKNECGVNDVSYKFINNKIQTGKNLPKTNNKNTIIEIRELYNKLMSDPTQRIV